MVSRLFYGAQLTTPACVAGARAQAEKAPLTWTPTAGAEAVGEGMKSYVNPSECEAVARVAATMRRNDPDRSIAVLTFYKGQVCKALKP